MRTRNPQNKTLIKLRADGHHIEEEELNKMKLLYFLYNYYNLMIRDLKSDPPIEETIMKYANKCVEEYRKLDSHCSDKTTDFCKALTDFKGKYEKTLLQPDIVVEWREKLLPPLNISKEVQPEDTVSSKTLISTSTAENVASKLHNEPSESMHQYEGTRESEENVTPNPLPLGSLSDSEKQISLKVEPQNNENNDILGGMGTHKITGTAIASLGASSIFFLFYKFTSFGSRFFKGRSKNNIRNDFNKQRNILIDSLEYQQNNPTLQSYNVAYDSI
ncbi:Plasmodium vivax Vir protein, putative [Plasmodium vivax]|uniref:Vir protein, putative n=1 Tax=Plasmodium vivax TaxID=5855 RepID=A0A1G4E6D7_PLAVI|nr:Plasmodium vivax Vir protein, putative [Plasmodium vivax]